MSRSPLRAALYVIGLLLVAGAAAAALAGCGSFALRLAIPGLALVLALLVERWRYKRVTGEPPGPGWVATGERFVDPESGALVTVYFNPASGERRYVAQSGSSPPALGA
jgi:hypothetical protein